MVCQCLRTFESTTVLTIHTYEISVTEPTDSLRTIGFSTTPEVTACKAAKYGWSTGLSTFSLQGQKGLFDDVGLHLALVA
jgi:hypothetical protein